MSIIDIGPGLRAYVLADAAIAAIVGARMYATQMPQGETKASIVFTLVSDIGDHHMLGPSGLARPRYQIDAWSTNLDEAKALGNLIKARIDGYQGLFLWGSNSPQDQVKVRGIFFDTARDLYESAGKFFGRSQDFIIWYAER
jgi:hypothetical protein